MKKYLFILILFLASCKKQDSTVTQSLLVATIEPSITKVTFFRVYAGSNESVGFDVDLISDSNTVSKVVLYFLPMQLRWEVKKPTTGRYRMYDHINDYPTYAMSFFYFFSFIKKDGSVVNTSPFQVY